MSRKQGKKGARDSCPARRKKARRPKARAFEISNLKFQIGRKEPKRELPNERVSKYEGLSKFERILQLRNQQRTRPINKRFLSSMVSRLMNDLPRAGNYDLTVNLVGAKKMTELNETVLRHAGSTDVITFDYKAPAPMLAGEIFVCVDEALLQSKRFRTTWQSELVRYIVHGVLHLLGHDDLKPSARAKMKSEENRLVRELGQEFDLRKLGVKTRVSG